MEEKLDDIAQGERPWVPMMREFYDPFAETLDRAQREIQHVNQTAEVTDQVCNKCGKPMSIKDSLIAASALTHDLSLATLNRRDFEPAKVRLVDPSAR